tara:strand:+ start:244 stop:879 length:636 start_codon:yes stop_codon:yes gene_type:complete
MILKGLDVLNSITSTNCVDIELGCGKRKRHPHAIGVDCIDYDEVDIVGDVFDILYKIPDSSVNRIYSYHFFEHIQEQRKLLDECARVLISNATMKVVVPHFSNPFYFSDPTHQCLFGLYTMSYYSDDDVFSRTIPKYNNDINFKLLSVKLIFKSYPPKYIRHAVKKIIQYFVNINSWAKEFYEENLVYIFPCYEIEFDLIRKSKVQRKTSK